MGSLRHEWALGAGLRCPREHPIWMSPYSERRLIQHAKQNIAQLSDGCPLQQSPSFFISLSKLTRRPESPIHSRVLECPSTRRSGEALTADVRLIAIGFALSFRVGRGDGARAAGEVSLGRGGADSRHDAGVDGLVCGAT